MDGRAAHLALLRMLAAQQRSTHDEVVGTRWYSAGSYGDMPSSAPREVDAMGACVLRRICFEKCLTSNEGERTGWPLSPREV